MINNTIRNSSTETLASCTSNNRICCNFKCVVSSPTSNQCFVVSKCFCCIICARVCVLNKQRKIIWSSSLRTFFSINQTSSNTRIRTSNCYIRNCATREKVAKQQYTIVCVFVTQLNIINLRSCKTNTCYNSAIYQNFISKSFNLILQNTLKLC